MTATVAIAGLGAIGLPLARALDTGAIPALRLAAVAAADPDRARTRLAGFATPPQVIPAEHLAEHADIVVEATPAAVFTTIAAPALAAGRTLLVCSAGALLRHMDLVRHAATSGGRVIVPTGALLGLDAVRAAAEGPVESVTLETRKPPAGLAGAPYLTRHGIRLDGLATPLRVFAGTAFDAAAGFPANVNVAAALALAGIGPIRTRVEIWADPTIDRNIHTIRVEAEAARFTMTIENVPSAENPRTGRITPLSVLACLRGLAGPIRVGT